MHCQFVCMYMNNLVYGSDTCTCTLCQTHVHVHCVSAYCFWAACTFVYLVVFFFGSCFLSVSTFCQTHDYYNLLLPEIAIYQ